MELNKAMVSSTKMLQILIDGQAALREEIKEGRDNFRKEMKEGQDTIRQEMKQGFRKVNKRLNIIGKAVAFLEDDTPTREEHDKLEKRVTKVEKKLQIQTS